MKHVFEHCGIILLVDYEPEVAENEGPTFNSVHVTDAEYRPVGPNLLALMHCAWLIKQPDTEGVQDAESILSTITAELPNAY